jgi:hypothetical protein
LKYALTYSEAKLIVKERNIFVDGRVRTDMTYPAGFMGSINFELWHPASLLLASFLMSSMMATPSSPNLIICRMKSLIIRDPSQFVIANFPLLALSLVYFYDGMNQDVVSIPKTNENFRLLYDAKGRYTLVPLSEDEAKVSLEHLIFNLASSILLLQSCFIFLASYYVMFPSTDA